MGRREEYLREYLSIACKQACRNKKYYKANKLLIKSINIPNIINKNAPKTYGYNTY